MANNSQVAHRWANNDGTGHLKGSNFYFDGACLFSYATMIGRIVADVHGNKVALINERNYSHSTQRHKSEALRALDYGSLMPYFEVTADVLNTWEYGNEVRERYLIETINGMIEEATKNAGKAKRARVYSASYIDIARACLRNAQALADAFGVHATIPNAEDAGITEELARVAEERRAAENKRKREEEKRAREEAREQFEAWCNGQRDNCPWSYSTDENGSAYLRVMMRNGRQVVQTSQGAEVTLKEATRAFKFVKLCRMTGRTFKTNGSHVPVGSFELLSVDENANVRIGCHYFTWERIEAFARTAGIFELPGDDEALIKTAKAQ